MKSSMWAVTLVVTALLAGCAGMKHSGERLTSPDAVVGKRWLWQTTVTAKEKIEVPNPERYAIEFKSDGKAVAQFDCNRGGGSYKIADGKLSFGALISTRMACPPGSLGDRFGADLGRVKSFYVEDGTLVLELPADSGSMRLRSAD